MSPSAFGAEEVPETKLNAGYKKGFFIEDKHAPFKLAIQGRVQTRFTYEAIEGFNNSADDKSYFTIQRARLSLKGHAFHKNYTYKFQADFGKGKVALKDFVVDFGFIPKKLHLSLGQFKKPFSRQQLNSSSKLEFVDRAITDKTFKDWIGRDVGLMLHNKFNKSPEFEWAFGLFNGAGSNKVPERLNPAIVARVGYNHGAIKGYSEGDLEGGDLRFAVGAATVVQIDSDKSHDGSAAVEVDYALKAHGFASTGSVFALIQQAENAVSKTVEAKLQKLGAHIQLSYMVNAKWQPALRYAIIIPQEAGNPEQEIALGLSGYFFGHNLQWQTDIAGLTEETKETDIRIRSQLQLSF